MYLNLTKVYHTDQKVSKSISPRKGKSYRLVHRIRTRRRFTLSILTLVELANVGLLCVAEMIIPTARSNNGVRAASIGIGFVA